MFTFSGRTGEFFKIWIVNILLTICTAGIYSAWAKVRTKRYFYRNTYINGDSFAYHANPVSILVARLIITVFIVAVFIVLGDWFYMTPFFLSLFLPWVMVRGFAFSARNSSYRNVRFHFQKKYLLFYLIYSPCIISFLLVGLLALASAALTCYNPGYTGFLGCEADTVIKDTPSLVVTLLVVNLAFLPVARAYHRYKAGQHRLGEIPFHFGEVGLSHYFLVIGKAILLLITVLLLTYAMELLYAMVLFAIFFISQYVGTCLFSLFWQNLKFEGGHFDSTIKPLTFFFKILLVNAFAIILSVGLLYPWAKIRRSRYVAEHLSVHIEDAAVLSRIKRARATEEGALGEEFEAVQRFDFDIALV